MSDLLCFHAFENIYGIPVHIIQEPLMNKGYAGTVYASCICWTLQL